MADSVLSALICMAFMATAIAVVMGTYLIARRVLGTGREFDRAHEAAGAVGGRLALLYGLILALVYAQELSDYKDIRAAVTEEAVAVADVFHDIRRYGGPEVRAVQQELLKYVSSVVDVEWDLLGRKIGLSQRGWEEWDNVYVRLLNLRPGTEKERYLANRMRDRITSIARLRQTREASIRESFANVFWPPALIGLILLAIPLYVYRPSRSHIVLLSVFGAYSGVILFFIYAFSDPFQKPARIEPVAFQKLQADFTVELARMH